MDFEGPPNEVRLQLKVCISCMAETGVRLHKGSVFVLMQHYIFWRGDPARALSTACMHILYDCMDTY